jgi:hypothetical protein
MAQEVKHLRLVEWLKWKECLPSKCEALSSNFSVIKNKIKINK